MSENPNIVARIPVDKPAAELARILAALADLYPNATVGNYHSSKIKRLRSQIIDGAIELRIVEEYA